jgi:hypothetical protein
VEPLGDGRWRVDLIDGSVTLCQQNPRSHLRLGYEPEGAARFG